MRLLFLQKGAFRETLGIPYLSAAIKERGHQVELLLLDQHKSDLRTKLEDFSPDILAYSVTTGLHKYYLELNRKIKGERRNVYSIFGGPHATYFPEMIEEQGVDALCIGEGEEALVEFLDTLERGGEASRVKNWWVKQGSKITRNPVRPLIGDLDRLTFPDRELVYAEDRTVREYGIKYFLASRGCPYNCSYCFNHSFNAIYRGKGPRVRFRSVNNMLAEIKQVRARYPLSLVSFVDDIFILSRTWFEEFAERFSHDIGIPFHCNVRANLVTPEISRLLRDAGCQTVTMAIEAGNDHLRNKILHRNMTKEQIVSACQLLRREGIQVFTQNMVGLPGGSLEADYETLHLNMACAPTYAAASIFQPYPKTTLGEYAVKEGFFDGDFNKIGYTFYKDSALRFEKPGEKLQIENLHKFFAIGVQFPFLLPLISFLIKLPPNGLFNFIYKFWNGYISMTKIVNYRMTTREVFVNIYRWLFKRPSA